MFEKAKQLLGLSKKSQDFIPISATTGFDHLFGNTYSNKVLRSLSSTDYLALYTGWSYFCVSRIAQTLGSIERQVVDTRGNVISDKNLSLIDAELIEGMTAFLLLNGSAFVKKQNIGRNIAGLDILRPDLVEFVQEKGYELVGYKYRMPNGQQMSISIEEMLDVHLFNPLQVYPNKTKGVSPMQSIAMQMSTDLATQSWNWKFFENGATPAGVFTVDKDASAESLERFKSDWRSKYGGVQNSHKTAVLPYGMDYKSITPSQAEMDFVNQRRFTKEEVFTIFGMPEALFDKNSNLATAKVAEKNFMKFTILPLARKIEQAINKKVYQGKGIFQFVNIVPTDIDELSGIYANGGITLNEYRQGMNYAPVKGGDVVQSSFGPVEAIIQDNEKQISEVNEKRVGMIAKAISESIPGTEDWKEKKWSEKIKRAVPYEVKYRQAMIKIFDTQESDIIKSISKKSKAPMDKWNELKYFMLYFSLLSKTQEEYFQQEATEGLKLAGINEVFVVGNTLKNGFLKDNLTRFAKDVDLTTKTEILDIISKAENEGLGVDATVNLVKEKFSQYKTSRVEAIVRTETILASSKAYETAWEDSGVVEAKEWYTSLDERVCPHCNSMNGKIVSLGDNYFKKGSTMPTGLKLDYMDVKGPSLHTSCRCTLLPVLKP